MFKHATMNRAYRLIWCEVRSTWVAVAEFARAHGKRSAAGIALSVALVAGMAGNSAAQNPAPTALPTGGQTVAGQVEIATVGSRMDVTQSSNSAIVNWDSFNIGSQAQVNFVQPSASAVILNRVLGGSGSMILGQMTANGNVFLVDPAGVIFAPGARVDVGGLVASSLGISDGNFLAAKYQFEGVGAGGAVENHGSINVANGGFVALIAPQVANKGTISAANGSIGMAAGEAVNLDFDHDGLLSFQVNFAAAAARVDNRGLIVADGGRVVMSAQAKDALLSTVLSNDGIVRARSVESRNGEIWLGGGSSGVVSVSGTLDASGTAAGQRGGTVKVLGDKVGLFEQAKVDVSGVGGGGTALVGGNWQGKGPEQNANVTYVGKDVTIIADAVGSGDGGKVVVWADGTTRFAGYVAARGGLAGGNGGTVEISGHEQLVSRGSLDLSAPNGKAGSVLFDPKNIIVANAGADPIATNDAFAENPTADATFDADLITALTNSGTAVTLQANNDITVNEAITSNNAGGNGGALTLHAGRSIAINADITTDSGDFTAIANHAGAQAADRDAGNATITMAGGTTIDAGSGAIAFSYGNGPNGNDATGAISLASLTTTGSISLASAANSGGSASTQAVSASGTISAGTLDLQSATSFTFNGNVSATTLTTAAQGYNLVLNGGATITNAVSFAHTGTLTLGNDAADVLLFDGGLTATDPSGVTLNGTVRTSGDAVSLGDGNTALTLAGTTSIIDTTNNGGTAAGAGITLGGAVDGTLANTQSLSLNAGTGGAIAASSTIGTGTSLATLTVTNSNGATFSGAVTTGTSVVLTDTTDATAITFNGALTTPTLTTAAQGYNLVLNGGATITNAVSFAHTGTLTLGNDAADVLLFDGGLTATDPSGVTLNGTVRTSGDAVSLGDGNTALTLAGTTSIIDTTNNGGTAAGAGITLGGAVDGTLANTQSLSLNAGTSGSATVTGALGAGTALGTLSVSSAGVSFGAIGGAGSGVSGNLTIRSTGGVSLGASRIGGYLDISAGGSVSQTGAWTIGGDLWVKTTGGDIALGVDQFLAGGYQNTLGGTVSLISPTSSGVAGAGNSVSIWANSIKVGKVRPSDSTTTDVGITGARVRIKAPSGSAIQADGTQGLVTADEPLGTTPALTIMADGVIGDPATGSPTSVGFWVKTKGLVKVVTDALSGGTVMLFGEDTFQPKYEFSGDPNKRSVKYNGVEATNAQLTGALDAAYLDIRNQTTEIRESGFAKENASKVLRRGVVTSAGPGQPAVDDSTGMAGAEECEGGFANDSLSCQ